MLRRLDERNKRAAFAVLRGGCASIDGLDDQPHDGGAKPPWPGGAQIEALRALGHCPSVFTLGPGEFVHINKVGWVGGGGRWATRWRGRTLALARRRRLRVPALEMGRVGGKKRYEEAATSARVRASLR